MARELSEAAHGGQVLLSHEGWVRLRQASRAAPRPSLACAASHAGSCAPVRPQLVGHLPGLAAAAAPVNASFRGCKAKPQGGQAACPGLSGPPWAWQTSHLGCSLSRVSASLVVCTATQRRHRCTALQDMAGAGFPVVEQLGQYKVESWPAPLWVYQVRPFMLRARRAGRLGLPHAAGPWARPLDVARRAARVKLDARGFF